MCELLEEAFSLYIDDQLTPSQRAACDDHLRECPVCRNRLAEMRSVARSLGQLSPPVPPAGLEPSISRALAIEMAARKRHRELPAVVRFGRWLEPRLFPYTVGSLASIIIFLGMFSALRLSLTTLHEWDRANRHADQMAYMILYAQRGDDTGPDLFKPVSPETYAAARELFADVSPSLNPRGSLAALTRSSNHAHADADDMVVVADVFSNGSASLAGIVQAPRDHRMLDDFEIALRRDAAFVPASFDRRPETMRVVFVVQKVNVPEREF
jgi:hypothetical protein